METTRQEKAQTSVDQTSVDQTSVNQSAETSARPSSLWRQLSGAFGGGDRRSLFSKRGTNAAGVKAGRIFRHSDGKGRNETATVIGLCEILGMPHVRYDLRIDQPGHRPFEDGPRVLGMKTFVEHFCEPVGS